MDSVEQKAEPCEKVCAFNRLTKFDSSSVGASILRYAYYPSCSSEIETMIEFLILCLTNPISETRYHRS